MKKAIVFGITDLAEILYHFLLEDDNIEVVAFTADEQYIVSDTFYNLPIISFETLKDKYSSDKYGIFVCVGYNKMNLVRCNIFKKVEALGYEILSYIHPTAQLYCNTIGLGTIALQNSFIDVFSDVGNGNIFYPNSSVAHHTKVGDFNFFAPSSCICGHAVIRNNCFLGANSTVINGINVADYTLVGAGSVITRDTLPESVIAAPRCSVLDKKSMMYF